MKVAAWLLAAVAWMVLAHWWPPAYGSICTLLALAAHERGPDRRRWRDSRRI